MKTIRNTKTGEIKRVDNKDANNMVGTKWQGWEYCSKSLWKTEVRGSVKVESKKVEKITSENLSDKKVRKQRKETKVQKYANK
jgi:hypothetical protein